MRKYFMTEGFSSVRHYMYGANMKYVLGLGVLAVLGYGLFYIIRQRLKRRGRLDVDIPAFLVGGDYPVNKTPSSSYVNRTEVYPCPKDN